VKDFRDLIQGSRSITGDF